MTREGEGWVSLSKCRHVVQHGRSGRIDIPTTGQTGKLSIVPEGSGDRVSWEGQRVETARDKLRAPVAGDARRHEVVSAAVSAAGGDAG